MNRDPGFIKKPTPLSDALIYSAIQLPSAISIWESSGFLVLRSENVQLPEGRNLGKLYPPGFLSKYFRPHLVNLRRFQPACCFTAGKSGTRRNRLQPATGFSSVQRMQTKLTPISLNGKYYRSSNTSRLEVKLTIS